MLSVQAKTSLLDRAAIRNGAQPIVRFGRGLAAHCQRRGAEQPRPRLVRQRRGQGQIDAPRRVDADLRPRSESGADDGPADELLLRGVRPRRIHIASATASARRRGASTPSTRLLDGVEVDTQVSAACSLYTTTYAVLEAYYIAMVTSGDVTARYLHLADEEWGRNTCDSLARKVDDMLRAFEPYRRRSLDAVWGGVVFLLIAYCCGCAPPLRRDDGDRWGMWFSIPPLAAGVVFVPRTVLMFRRAFVPLVERYRTLDGADAAEPIRTCGDYITSRRGGSPR